MPTTTMKALRRDLYEVIPNFGFNGTADSLTATSLTDSKLLRNSNYVAQQFTNATIFRPARTGADREKPATSLVNTTGALSHGGSDYSDTADTEYEIMRYITPTEAFLLLQEVMEEQSQETLAPLTLVTDGDMGNSATSDWTASSATLSKVTTPANIFNGQRALRVQATDTNGHAQSAAIRVTAGTHVYVSTICRADVGTARLALWDVTNSTEFGSAVTHSEESWQRLWRHEAVPSGCKEFAIRIGGTADSDDIYFDHVVAYRMADKIFVAPSWMDEGYRFRKLRRASYIRSAANRQDDAHSQCFEDWINPTDFMFYPLYHQANFAQIRLRRPLVPADFWIDGQRKASDFTTFTNDDSGEGVTTTFPRKTLVYSWASKICEYILGRQPENIAIRAALARNRELYAAERASRPVDVPFQRTSQTAMYGSVS